MVPIGYLSFVSGKTSRLLSSYFESAWIEALGCLDITASIGEAEQLDLILVPVRVTSKSLPNLYMSSFVCSEMFPTRLLFRYSRRNSY